MQTYLLRASDDIRRYGTHAWECNQIQPSIARIVTLRKVHVGHVGTTEETRNTHRMLVERSLVKRPLIV